MPRKHDSFWLKVNMVLCVLGGIVIQARKEAVRRLSWQELVGNVGTMSEKKKEETVTSNPDCLSS